MQRGNGGKRTRGLPAAVLLCAAMAAFALCACGSAAPADEPAPAEQVETAVQDTAGTAEPDTAGAAQSEQTQAGAARAQESVSDVRRRAEQELTQVEAQSAQLETLFDNARDQSELNRYSGALFTLWDDEINALWAHLKDSMDASSFDSLTDEQIDWIVDKEAAIDQAGSEVSGGTMEPMVRNLTGYEWTRDRVYYLMDYLP